MHDWQRLIREKLAGSALAGSQRENLVRELANHLEDLHAELLTSGVAESEASTQCLNQLDDVHQIAASKRSQPEEGLMNQRTKTLWVPGLVTLTMASVSLAVLQVFTFSRPRLYLAEGGAVAVGMIWLFSLLPCGALGASLSRRAGGSRSNLIVASLFPSLIMLAVCCLVLPIASFFEGNSYIIHHPRYFGLALLFWTVIPGALLLLGALPVLVRFRTQPSERTDAPRTTA